MAVALRQPYRLQTAAERQQEEQVTDESLTLTDLLRIVLKHKWTLLLVIFLACSVAAVRTFLSTPIYRSTVILQIDRAAQRVVSFNNDVDREQASEEPGSLTTQVELLKSRSLAERVIDELRLDQSAPTGPAAATTPLPQADARGSAEAAANAKGDYGNQNQWPRQRCSLQDR